MGGEKEAEALLGEYLQRKKLDLEGMASTVRRLHDSSRAQDHATHRCVLLGMLGEWPLLPRYPDKELKLFGRLFGRLVQMGLTISDGLLAIMLRHVFEALRLGCAGLSPKLLTWGIAALREFVGRLHHWPAYCVHFLSLADRLAKLEPELAAAVRGAWTAAQKMTAARRAKRDALLGLSASLQVNMQGSDGMPSLQQLLAGLGLQKYAARLEANEIDLEAIALCADADFAEMEIPKGPRVKIAHALRQLEAKQAASTPTKSRPPAAAPVNPHILPFKSSVLPNGVSATHRPPQEQEQQEQQQEQQQEAAEQQQQQQQQQQQEQPTKKGWGRLPAAKPVPIGIDSSGTLSSGASPVAQWAKTTGRQTREPEPEPESRDFVIPDGTREVSGGELDGEDLLRMKSAEGEALVMNLIDSFDDDGAGWASSVSLSGAAGGLGGAGVDNMESGASTAEPWMLNGGAFWGGSGSIDESPVKASTTWESWGTGAGTGGAGVLPVTTSGSGSNTPAGSALGGIDSWSASVGKIAVGSFDPGGSGVSARPSERLRESSRLASTFGVATAPGPSTQQVGTTGGGLETTDPLAIDAFASSGFGDTFADAQQGDADAAVTAPSWARRERA